MKKLLRRILPFMLAVSMVLTSGIVVFADEKNPASGPKSIVVMDKTEYSVEPGTRIKLNALLVRGGGMEEVS